MSTGPARTFALLAVAVAIARCSGCGSSEEPGCPSGQVKCEGFCVDPASFATDPASCGACGIACGFGTCAAGACQCEGGTLCGGNPRCSHLTDPQNCGACGHACTRAGEGCSTAGGCGCLPGSPFPDDCVWACTNLMTDPLNCGACLNACPLTNEVCVAGNCQCPQGDIQCPQPNPTMCVNPRTDSSNCGECGIACTNGKVCNAGLCECPAGTTLCNGACVDTQTDPTNCGGCGNACATGATCSAGACACPSDAPVACGAGAGTCCAGTGCCSGACQTQHSNGVGQNFYDCSPLATYNQAQAEKAAQAWHPADATTTEIPGANFACPGCIGWQASSAPSSCGTWCYAGPYQGRVFLVPSLVCVCTTLNPGTWN